MSPTGPDSQKLKLYSQGKGGIDELSESLTEDMIGYCLARETDQVDSSVTVKFVFILWLGEKAPRMQKSRTSTHLGYIKNFIGVC